MKKRSFVIILLILIAVVVITIITNILLDTTGSINQGKFRVNDAVIKSMINVDEIENKSEEGQNALESLSLNISQNNSLIMLIEKSEEIDKIYLDNIKLTNPEVVGAFEFSYGDNEKNVFDISNEQVEIYKKEQEGQYLVQINFDNKNFLTNAKIPDGVNLVTYDGTILRTLDIPIAKLKFNLRFNLNIVEKTGKVNVCKIELNLPNEELLSNGIDIRREDLSGYRFKIKDNFNLFNLFTN